MKMKVLVILICAGLSIAARRSYEKYIIEHAEVYFEEFIKTYNKQYADEDEKLRRFEIFKQNLEHINRRNLESDTAEFGITLFCDLTVEEFLKMYTGLGSFKENNCDSQTRRFTSAAPESFDWREQKKVSKVKNQGACGSCWAFGATGNLESQYAIKYNKLVEFSEQQLVDCDERSGGCEGTADLAYPYMYWMENGAISEEDYPYEAKGGSCRFDASRIKMNVTGCVSYHAGSEDRLREILHEVGPLTMAVDADSFQFYRNKVLADCAAGPANHAVLLVGYGTEDGVPYWTIKNSWGESFGESGYIKVKRGVNACGILNVPAVSARIA